MSKLAVGIFLSVALLTLSVALLIVTVDHDEAEPMQYQKSPGDFLAARKLRGSTFGPDVVSKANAAYGRMLSAQQSRGAQPVDWQFVGPVDIGGRILDITTDSNSPDTLYVASATGGVWKSTDAADTFSSVWPIENDQAIGALALDSNGRLYAGTGESLPGGGSPTFGNQGIFASDDGGMTWASLGLSDSERISRVIIDPSNENRILVAATGPLYVGGGERGVYESLDAGATWTRILAGENDTTGASDVYVDPGDPNRVFAVLWDHQRQPSLRRYGGVGSGIFRSLDGGVTWSRLQGGLPPRAPDVGRIGLAAAPSDPNRLYAVYSDELGFFSNFYVSVDGGNTWSPQPNVDVLADSIGRSGYWFSRIWVDPNVATRVFAAGVILVNSENSGDGWAEDTSIHVDHHAMVWDPLHPGRVYLGNDGGVYRSENNGEPPWVFASVQPFTQFYTLDVSEIDPDRVVAGTQDNGCVRNYRVVPVLPADNDGWNNFSACGDGLEVLINYLDQDIVYACAQYGFCYRSDDGGDTTGDPIGATSSIRRNWYTPLVFDPQDPGIMYFGGERVHRSVNGALSFSDLSGDLTNGDPNPTPIDYYPYGTITTIAPARTSPGTIYVGTDDGLVWFTHDLGASWTRSTDPDLPDRWVTRIVASETDANTAYITYSGFRNGDDTPYILRTTDGGVNWDNITSNLPQAPLNAFAWVADGELIVGGDIGVFNSFDDGASWSIVGTGLPRVPVMDLRVHYPSASMFVATFGRGIWVSQLPNSDSDGDGLAAGIDNCLLITNPAQRDTDGDGIGNFCDADFDNNCVVNFMDLAIFKNRFFSNDADADMNDDGTVNFGDLLLLKSQIFGPPGPSGTSNICT